MTYSISGGISSTIRRERDVRPCCSDATGSYRVRIGPIEYYIDPHLGEVLFKVVGSSGVEGGSVQASDD